MPFLIKPRRHSLLTKLLISIVAWLICAILVIGLTLNFSWELEGGGVAINDAGTLRMRTYHMVALLNYPDNAEELVKEKNNFERILLNLQKMQTHSWLVSDSKNIHEQIGTIRIKWQNEIAPLIVQRSLQRQTLTGSELEQIDQFVQKIHTLVKLYEIQNTKSIQFLRFFQFLFIAMILVTASSGIYLLLRQVIWPLENLRRGIDNISQGDLTSRVRISSKDEFGIVATGFNQMASHLQDLYDNLEQKVYEKTHALEQKNHELSALYEVTAFLHKPHTQDEMALGFLKYIMALYQADAGSIRLLDKNRRQFEYISSIGLSDEFLSNPTCTALDTCYCGAAVEQPIAIVHNLQPAEKKELVCVKANFDSLVVFHIRHSGYDIGIVTLYFRQPNVLAPQDLRLVEALSTQLGTAIENQRLASRDRQFAVVEERNLMAQGLHDSIAQSLTFLNLQVQMLEKALNKKDFMQAQENLTFIREGVQESYEDVRELLLNFRTRISKEEFPDAVQSLIRRFQQQVPVEVSLDISGNGPSLNPQQQLQAIFILQEALSNIRKHAHAKRVNIQIKNNADFIMTIQDDGVGFDPGTIQNKTARHVGMSIMKERASQIFSNVDIQSGKNQGTRVTLTLAEAKRKSYDTSKN